LIVPLRLVAAGYTSAQALSLYGVAMGMSIPFLFIPSTIIGSLSTALVPDLSSAVVKNDTEYIKKRVVSAIKFTIFISALFVPLYMGAGETIGIFFFDNALSGILLAQAAWVVLPLGLTNITSSLLNSLGYEVKSMVNYIVGAVILLVSIWFLPKAIGINALIFGFGGLFLTTCVFNLKMLKKILGIKLNISKFLIFTLAFIVPSASITSLVCNLLNNFMPKFFSLAISCTLGCLFFVLLYFVFNLIQFKTITCWIEQKIKHRKVKKLKRKKRKRIAFFVHKS